MSSRDLVVAAAGASAPSDPNFKNVSLLLQGDGTNGAQNNTFLDSSTNNFTITRNGNTTQGTFSPYGNLWSNYFDGSGDYLTWPSGASVQFGTGDFTVEGWIYLNVAPAGQYIIDARDASNTGTWVFGFGLSGVSNGKLGFYDGATLIEQSSATITAQSFAHVIAVRSGSTLSVYINGNRVATATNTRNISATPATSYIANRYSGTGYELGGYISNLRIVKGTAVYDPTQSTITVPTTPLTAVSGTSLLTCQSNRFIDNSSNNFTLTVNGNTSVQRFSPFNPTAPYSAATIGGSGYFDGTGDYLQTPSNSAFTFDGSFTVEFWVNFSALPSNYISLIGGTTANTQMFITTKSNGTGLRWGLTGVAEYAAGTRTWSIGTWNHIAVVRNGSDVKLYANGINISDSTYSNSTTYSGVVQIGGNLGVADLNGYISNLRIVKGTAVYSSNFTPPTAPLTAITNTSLLCNFTNAGITDAAMMNDLETVGNAQVSTSVKKYGTGSLAFDGTGDYITAPTSPNLGIGSGNFTIEFWLYANTVSGYQTVLDLRTSQPSAGPSIYFANNSRLNYLFNSGTAYAFGPNPLLANTWYHVAWVRSGTTHTLYVDGQSQATFTDSAGLTSSPLAIGARQAGGYADYFNGYIDDLRITKGYARYTANFTPPAQALPTN